MIKIELTLHPEARDGQPNAWKVEMFGTDGDKVFAETCATAASCLDEAKRYICGAKAQVTIKVDPELVRALFGEQEA